ncbi:unnamed protein product [Cylicocyclus nassatus]|uniref:Uncharacterized protein n=1 Tax=Cylicocyclus nassatus TaxID=53992 RepID=A0AA36M177_CYLNA|nr:unnamed protein product [Cylicocyclus nassatus]
MKSPVRLVEKAHSLLFRVSRQLQMTESVSRRNSSRCCGLIHVRTLALLIAVLESAFLIYQGIAAVSHIVSTPSSPHHHHLLATVYALAVLIAWVAVGLLLLGVLCQIPALLVPHMLMQVLLVLTLLGMASFAVYALFVGTSLQVRITVVGEENGVGEPTDSRDASAMKASFVSGFLTGLLGLFIAVYFLAALVNIWCFNVVLDCYRWLGFQLEEKHRALSRKDIIPITGLDTKPVTVIHSTDF